MRNHFKLKYTQIDSNRLHRLIHTHRGITNKTILRSFQIWSTTFPNQLNYSLLIQNFLKIKLSLSSMQSLSSYKSKVFFFNKFSLKKQSMCLKLKIKPIISTGDLNYKTAFYLLFFLLFYFFFLKKHQRNFLPNNLPNILHSSSNSLIKVQMNF